MNEGEQWKKIEEFFQDRFTLEDPPTIEFILLIIGIQEVGLGFKKYKKDEKLNLIHVAVCKLLEPYNYYRFKELDKDGWPHYEIINNLPPLNDNEQSILIKTAIIQYFSNHKII